MRRNARTTTTTLLAAVFLFIGGALFAGDAAPWSDASGSGDPTIVLIHGAGSDPTVWDLVMPELSSRHRVVRVELPGHGASPTLTTITLRDVAKAVDRALEQRKVERALLVGHSYGAWVALEEAAAHPKRAAGVVVLDMGTYTPPDTARTAILEKHMKDRYPSLIRVIFEVMSRDPVEADSAVARALRVPQPILSDYLRDSWRTDLRPRIKNLKVPVAVIATEATWPVSQPWERAKTALGYETAGPVAGYRLMGSGHLEMRDQPDSLNVLIEKIAADLPKR